MIERRFLLLVAALAAALLACPKPDIEGGLCGEDSDCTNGNTCLFDADRATSYCTHGCVRDVDCPTNQFCSDGFDSIESGATELKLCVDRVRSCDPTMTQELCNGLDDDCDTMIDGPSCQPITGCLDDVVCGAFVCQAPSGAPLATCLEKNADALTQYGDPCTSPSECENNDCTIGQCLPFCRPGDTLSCGGSAKYCAKAVGPSDQPPHNVCFNQCQDQRDCTAPQACVWREVYFGPDASQNGIVHVPVCSTPGPNRKALGETCTGNNPAGDDECAYGLCFDFVCTKLCAGAGDDCDDIGADFICREKPIFYSDATFTEDICVRRQ